jgi:general secretion pathway protein L
MSQRMWERLRALAGEAAELFRWWCSELKEMAQLLLRQWPSRKTPQLLVRVTGRSASVEQRDAQGWKEIGAVPMREDGSWPEGLPGLPAELLGARAAIVLPEADLYFETMDLPLAAERQLSSVLRLQLERRLPVTLEDLLIDHEVIARDKRLGILRVRAAVAHRQPIEALRKCVTAWGLVPVSAGIAETDGALSFNLLRRRRDPIRWSPTALDRRLLRYTALAAMLLCVVVGAQWLRERITVNSETAELRAQAQRLSAQRMTLSARAAPLLSLRALATAPGAPELLANLSAAVPKSAWFTHVDLSTPADAPGQMKMTGTVGSTDEIVAALRAVPGVHNVRASSAFNGEILGHDRVEITADFQPNKAKAGAL